MAAFDTISYCIAHQIPCFTFAMDASKACFAPWKEITPTNFLFAINRSENGFAIITGYTHVVIDFDLKHDPPLEIYDILEANCEAIERTPGGYHFWFKGGFQAPDQGQVPFNQVSPIKNATDASWDGSRIKGLDIRGSGGICYTAPSYYMVSGERKEYVWCKGDLSTATVLPECIQEHLDKKVPLKKVKEVIVETDDITIILAHLSMKRCNNYQEWIQVGMILKTLGYPCLLWDTWSQKSSSYVPGTCDKKWRTFRETENPLGIGTLYHWLKQDNYSVFIGLQSAKKSIQDDVLFASHASIANAFYMMNPNQYVYSTEEGWYVLQSNNTWVATGSTDILRIPQLLNDMHRDMEHILLGIKPGLQGDESRWEAIRKLFLTAGSRISHSGFLRSATAFLSGMYYVQGVERLFNERRELFAFTNGAMDMSTFTFRKIVSCDYITVTCGYDYREGTTAEKDMVRSFLGKIFPDSAVLAYVLNALSRTFVGSNVDQLFHVFTGAGANGKSCIMDLCKIVFGDYYQTFSVSYLTKENDGKDRPLPELAAARYARMLVTSEPDERDRFQINLIKNITGNEEVSFRGMYAKSATKYIPQYKMWILTNDMPKLSKYDQAIERRMRCVHFPTRFVYQPRADNEALRDDSLSERFKAEEGWRYGLLGLLLDSARENAGGRLDMPAEVRSCTDAYMLENNPVGAWLRDRYDITGRRDDIVQKTELYKAFLEDTQMHKTQKAFSEDMVKCGVNERKTNTSRFYIGLQRKIETP
jgi:P4 family phage/plasmid primase-like protien